MSATDNPTPSAAVSTLAPTCAAPLPVWLAVAAPLEQLAVAPPDPDALALALAVAEAKRAALDVVAQFELAGTRGL